MTGQMVFWMSFIIIVTMSIGWLWLGSRDALGCYRSDVKEGREPRPYDFSLNFSIGAAYAIFFMGVLIPAIYLLEENGVLTKESGVGFIEAHGGVWFFVGTLLVFLGIFVTACEWLLRKMARRYEPDVRFEKWPFLK